MHFWRLPVHLPEQFQDAGLHSRKVIIRGGLQFADETLTTSKLVRVGGQNEDKLLVVEVCAGGFAASITLQIRGKNTLFQILYSI